MERFSRFFFLLFNFFANGDFELKVKSEEKFCLLERSLVGNGFHRWLDTKITISLNDNYKMKPPSLISCEAFFMQEVPSSFYVDPYENKNLHEFGGPKVLTFGDIDVEKPSFLSPSAVIYIYDRLTIQTGSLSANVTLPLHVRYHEPGSESVRQVSLTLLKNPQVFVACHPDVHWPLSFERIFAPCSVDTSSNCSWTEIPCLMSFEDKFIDVPVGNLNDLTLVALVTVLTVSIATIGLVAAMCFHPDNKMSS